MLHLVTGGSGFLVELAISSLLGEVGEVMEHTAFPVLRVLNPRFANAAIPHLRHGDISEEDLARFGAYVNSMIGAGAMKPDGLDPVLRRRVKLPVLEEAEV